MTIELYVKILREHKAAGVYVRTEAPGLTNYYVPTYKKGQGGGSVDTVHLPRSIGGKWITPDSTDAELEEFATDAAAAGKLTEEICAMSHELGHHFAPVPGYEEAIKRIKDEVSTEEDDNLVLEEEKFAWGWARDLLNRLGCEFMDHFEAIRAQTLDTYHKMVESNKASRAKRS